jgi:hypothetical protein
MQSQTAEALTSGWAGSRFNSKECPWEIPLLHHLSGHSLALLLASQPDDVVAADNAADLGA